MTASPPASVIACVSRVDRAAGRTIRERDRRLRGAERRRPGRGDVEACETLIRRLTEIHKIDFKRIDWAEIEAKGPVMPTIARDAVSAAARKRLQDYRPSLFETLLGLERERRRELTDKVVEAARLDAELWARAKAEAEAHNRTLALAPDVRALKPEAIAGVLKANGAAHALKELCEGFSLRAEAGRLVAQVDLLEYDALPDETCKTVGPAMAYAELPEDERRQLQLANAASVVLRAAAEVLQAAPVDSIDVVARVCRPGGLAETDLEPVLYVKVPAAAFAKLELKKLDAAPMLAAFAAKMDWSATRGFVPIDLADVGLGGPPAVAA